jgi:predicted MFS family arabinose efflux permease
MVSFGNAGVTLGTFLGGFIITRYGIQQVIWISIALLLVTLALTFVFVRKRATVQKAAQEPALEQAELEMEEQKAALGI